MSDARDEHRIALEDLLCFQLSACLSPSEVREFAELLRRWQDGLLPTGELAQKLMELYGHGRLHLLARESSLAERARGGRLETSAPRLGPRRLQRVPREERHHGQLGGRQLRLVPSSQVSLLLLRSSADNRVIEKSFPFPRLQSKSFSLGTFDERV